jgi:hypothetical protein
MSRCRTHRAKRLAPIAAALVLALFMTLVAGAPAGADDQTTLSSSILCNATGNTTDNVTVFPPQDFIGRFRDGYRDWAIVQYFTFNETTGTFDHLRWSEWYFNNDAYAGTGTIGGRSPTTDWFDLSTGQWRASWKTTYPLGRHAAAKVWILDGRLAQYVTTWANAAGVLGGTGYSCAPRAQYCYLAGPAGVTCTL